MTPSLLSSFYSYRSYFYFILPLFSPLRRHTCFIHDACDLVMLINQTGGELWLNVSATGEKVQQETRVHNPITCTCSSLDPLLSSAAVGLAWTDDGNSSSPNHSSPPTSPPGTLAETWGYDYKHHLFSRLTYPGMYSSLQKTKQTSIRAPAAWLAENARTHAPRPVRQVLMCTSVQNRGFISLYLSRRLQ